MQVNPNTKFGPTMKQKFQFQLPTLFAIAFSICVLVAGYMAGKMALLIVALLAGVLLCFVEMAMNRSDLKTNFAAIGISLLVGILGVVLLFVSIHGGSLSSIKLVKIGIPLCGAISIVTAKFSNPNLGTFVVLGVFMFLFALTVIYDLLFESYLEAA